MAAVRGFFALVDLIDLLLRAQKVAASQTWILVALLVLELLLLVAITGAAFGKKWAFGVNGFLLLCQFWGIWVQYQAGRLFNQTPWLAADNLFSLVFGLYCVIRFAESMRTGA